VTSWGPGLAVYLVASCFNAGFQNQETYIFYSYDFTNLAPKNWAFYGGGFGTQADAHRLLPGSGAQFLTELDAAQRADGSLVAVTTGAALAGGVLTQYSCVAADFNLRNPSDPLGNAIATVDYVATNSQSNACAYEPSSRTGMFIVGKSTFTRALRWVIMGSGIMP
jgi:hypothetical protein